MATISKSLANPWDHISAEELVANLMSLTTSGPSWQEFGDRKAIERLDSATQFTRYWQNDAFVIYHLAISNGASIEAHDATASLVERTARRWVIDISKSTPGATLLLKMSHYPLWHAQVNGVEIPLTANANGSESACPPEHLHNRGRLSRRYRRMERPAPHRLHFPVNPLPTLPYTLDQARNKLTHPFLEALGFEEEVYSF